jgi:hypothetical protein
VHLQAMNRVTTEPQRGCWKKQPRTILPIQRGRSCICA